MFILLLNVLSKQKFYIWKDWQIILVFNWFCTDRASERITDCLTCSWALLFCWEMLLINFSLLGVFVLIVICCCFYILYFLKFASEVFRGGVGGCCVVILTIENQISVLLLTFWFNCPYVYGKVCKNRFGFFWQRYW